MRLLATEESTADTLKTRVELCSAATQTDEICATVDAASQTIVIDAGVDAEIQGSSRL